MTVAVILAAGAGSRIGTNKALLQLGRATFLGRIVGTARRAGVARIVVVVGHQADEVKRALPSGAHVVILENPRPERGQLSSLHIALATLAEARGVLAWPVDHPLVKSTTVERLLRVSTEEPAKIIVPCYGGRGGHPTLFPRVVFEHLLALSPDRGAREVFASDPEGCLRLAVDDPGVRADIDTRADYERWCTVESRR
jgi:molybdenum cofactor cytidylyltransferase